MARMAEAVVSEPPRLLMVLVVGRKEWIVEEGGELGVTLAEGPRKQSLVLLSRD
jgi:hypothetical protein